MTEAAQILIDSYGKNPIGGNSINEVFLELKNEPDINKIDENYRSIIKSEIEKRLEKIGYWEFIPVPEKI